MFMRRSTLAVTVVIAMSAAAGATQVFAFDEGDAPIASETLQMASPQSLDTTVALVEKAR